MNRTYMIVAMVLAAVVFTVFQGAVQREYPLPADMAEQSAGKPELSTKRIKVPGPDGVSIEAEFYALEAIPPFGEVDVCDVLRERAKALNLLQIKPQLTETADPVPNFCPDFNPDMTDDDSFSYSSPVSMMRRLNETDNLGDPDTAFSATLERTILTRLREAKTVADVQQAIEMSYGIDDLDDWERLHFSRFRGDLIRLSGQMCSKAAATACKVGKWIEAARIYADVGSLNGDDRNFRDVELLLNSILADVRKVKNISVRTGWMTDIASAFGYAGQAGRSGNLTGRAVEISRGALADLEQAKDPSLESELDDALGGLAANLGRHAPFATDKKSVFEEAVEVGSKAIMLDEKRFPGSPSWSKYANRSADRLQLFSYSMEQQQLDLAVSDARTALEASGKNADNEAGAHTMYRLGEALAWRATYSKAEGEQQKTADAKEAGELLAKAMSFYQRTGSANYQKYIRKAMVLLAPSNGGASGKGEPIDQN